MAFLKSRLLVMLLGAFLGGWIGQFGQAAPPDAPLLANPHLELDADGDAWPDHWDHPKTGVTWEQEGGNHFLRIKAAEPGKMLLIYQAVPLPAGIQALELSWRQRVSGLRTGKQNWFDARLILDFKDGAGKKLSPSPSAPNTGKDSAGWVEKSALFLVPDGARLLELMPCLFHVETGVLDIDDLTLRAADPAPIAAAAKLAAESRKPAPPVVPEAALPSRWPPPLHVEGNQVLSKTGAPVWLQGINVVSLEFLVQGDHLLKSVQVAIEDWKANVIRLPVKEDYWFGQDKTQSDGGEAYRKLIDAAVALAANRGAYLLLDLHRFRAPRAEHAAFWKAAALRYSNHPAVFFDRFNETHGTTWEVWRDGGFVPEKDKPADEDAFTESTDSKGFQSVGMQALVDAVRSTGARNVIVAGGLDWAYDLTGIAAGFALEDKGGSGIIYSTHIYPWKRGWQKHVLVIADKYPILVGEVGADIQKMSFIPAEAQEDPYTWAPDMLGFLQEKRLHWTAFSFHPKATPVMITGWDYTPTPFWGAFVKRALRGEGFPEGRTR